MTFHHTSVFDNSHPIYWLLKKDTFYFYQGKCYKVSHIHRSFIREKTPLCPDDVLCEPYAVND